ncbi:MAG: carbohydrate-binding protein [Phycisphaerae bacterium]|nr:carbohydrate-binding protein [Phycisphaerae bacterium]
MSRVVVWVAVLAILVASVIARGDPPIWGRLANPGFENEPIRSAFFFTGSCRDGVPFYEHNPSPNTGLYTIHPSDARHLRWSQSDANRTFAVDAMVEAGVNVIHMSYWGPRGTDNWAHWAPMQTSTYSHDELFQAVLDKDILIAPYVEACAATANAPGFSFQECFPGREGDPAPAFIARVEDLIHRYIAHPEDPRWTDKWAQVYDRSAGRRYLVCVIGVASDQDGMTDQRFAEGFDLVADRIHHDMGVRVGFAIDVMPPDTYLWASFLPSAETTGPWLARQASILAIQPYFSGHSIGVNDEGAIMKWKQSFASKWINTGIPFIQDISPGYDAHLVFPGPHIFGNTDSFRHAQSELVVKLACQGVTFSAWNGYTEGYAAVPTMEYADANYRWAADVFQSFVVDSVHPIPGRIEAEDYERMSGVDKEIADDDGGGFNVGWLDRGDWLDYKVAVPADDEYAVRLRIARLTDGPSGQGRIQADGAVAGSFSVPGTGGWQNWQTIEATLPLQAGEQRLRLYIDVGQWNLNWLEFRRQADLEFGAVPGRIEAEDYDDMRGIKTQIVLDEEPGFNAGWFDAGDWLDYLVDVEKAGDYDVALRVALADGFSSGLGRLCLDGQPLWAFAVPSTGGWQNWKTIAGDVRLAQGRHRLRVEVTQGPWNLNWLELTRAACSRSRPR